MHEDAFEHPQPGERTAKSDSHRVRLCCSYLVAAGCLADIFTPRWISGVGMQTQREDGGATASQIRTCRMDCFGRCSLSICQRHLSGRCSPTRRRGEAPDMGTGNQIQSSMGTGNQNQECGKARADTFQTTRRKCIRRKLPEYKFIRTQTNKRRQQSTPTDCRIQTRQPRHKPLATGEYRERQRGKTATWTQHDGRQSTNRAGWTG